MPQLIELGNRILQPDLSFEDFIKSLEFINLKLRGKEVPDEETGICKEDMIVGSLVSPSNEIQLKILKRLYDTLHEDLDPITKGMICYYTLNNLHLFQDGNGRTSRFLYQLFCNDFNEEYLYHLNFQEDVSKRTRFENDNGLLSVEQFLNRVNYNLFLNMLSKGIIYDCKRMHEYNRVSTYTVDLYSEDHFITSFLSDKVVEELGADAKEVARNISNRNCSFSLAGLAMCELLTRKNKLQEFIKLNDEHFEKVSKENNIDLSGNLLFYVGSKGEFLSDVNTEQWDVKTCKEFLAISESLLLEQYEMIITASKFYANKKQKSTIQDDPTLK